MNVKRWWRLRQLRRRRELIGRLRFACDRLNEARQNLKANRAYQSVCVGGLEDKVEWERQAENLVRYWERELSGIARKLNLSQKERARYLGIRDVSMHR